MILNSLIAIKWTPHPGLSTKHNPAVGEFAKRTLRKTPFSLEPVEIRREYVSHLELVPVLPPNLKNHFCSVIPDYDLEMLAKQSGNDFLID
jgi:hypothetical protein